MSTQQQAASAADPTATDAGAAQQTVAELVRRARAAMAEYQSFDQQRVDEVITAIGWVVVDEANNRSLCEQAVADTGLGNVADKMIKNRRKTMGLLRDLRGAPSVGVIRRIPEKGLIEIARPVGVVAAVTPSTNPVATPVNKAINALKGRNAVILSPSPKGQPVCARLSGLMREALARVGAPVDLVQVLPAPVSKATTQAVMEQADLVAVTGSQNNVRRAYTCGTPAVAVGAGNVSSIVDETADVAAAAKKIVASKTFDNATSCSSENSVIAVSAIAAELRAALQAEGCAFLDAAEREQLQAALFPGGRLSATLIAQSAGDIASAAGLGREGLHNARVLVVDGGGVGRDHPFSGEKLSPVLSWYEAADFDAAMQLSTALMEHQGKGHSVGLHSADPERALRLGLEMPSCRVIVNQAHCFANGGSFDNGLPFSLSMGCGSWGGNSISENLNYRHFLNTVRISTPIAPLEPTVDELFGDYRAKYGL